MPPSSSAASSLLRFLALAMLASSAASCGPVETDSCNPSNCNGCCVGTVCRSGTTNDACGVGGSSCRSCSGVDSCTGGFCLAPAGGNGPSCVKKTCAELNATCGIVPDGCGGMVNCGECSAGESCGGGGTANQCGAGTCVAQGCAALGKNCGQLSDGCSGTLNCGTCNGGATCGGGGTANVCGTGCVKTTCTAQGKNCGTIPDGCGGTLSCGTCGSGTTCGGGGVANVCGTGCVPTTCAAQGKNCGSIPNGCGGTLSCGSCSAGSTCGGGGTANVCGAACVPTTCAAQGKNCGSIPNGCGGTLSCGSCGSGELCGASNVCAASCPGGCPSGFTCNASGACEGGDVNALVLNVPSATVSGTVRLNGTAPVKTSACTSGESALVVRFHEVTQGLDHRFYIPCSATTFNWSLSLYRGTYRVTVENIEESGGFRTNLPPVSGEALINPGLVVNGNLTNQVLDVKSANVTGTVRLDGAAITKTAACVSDAVDVRFSEPTLGYDAVVSIPCTTTTFNWSLPLYPGTYRVFVSNRQSSSGWTTNLLPTTNDALADQPLSVTGAVSGHVVNVKIANVSGTVKLNGATPAKTSACTTGTALSVAFLESTSGAYQSVSIPCSTTAFDWSARLYTGTYRVTVANNGSPDWTTNLPETINAVVVNPALTLTANATNQLLNVKSATVSGSVRLNGALPTKTTSCTGDALTLVFKEETLAYSEVLKIPCTTTTFNWSLKLYQGTYRVSVANRPSGSVWATNLPPTDSFAIALPSLAVNGNLTNQLLDVKTANVSGTVRLNGAKPIVTTSCSVNALRLRFQELTSGEADSFDIPCSTTTFDWTAKVYAGTYRVSVVNLPAGSVFSTNLLKTSDDIGVLTALAANTNTPFQVLELKTATASGTVRLNGAAPTKTNECGSTENALAVRAVETTHGNDFVVLMPCSATTFDWTTELYAGTYRFQVGNIEEFPGWRTNLPSTNEYAVVLAAAIPPSSSAPLTQGVVVSQIYGGGGNYNATYTNDFIELFNAGTTTVNLSGWSVQYAPATGSSWQVTPLSGSLAPGRYLLIQQAAGSTSAAALPTPDLTGTINLSATAGRVALVSNTTAISDYCPAGPSLIDMVGYGFIAYCYEGEPTADASNTKAVVRAGGGCTDTDYNVYDFSLATPAPRNSTTATHSCP